ncbi:MAG: hypothetical protein A2840_00430 [Candidatus Buchananbacteria bacterium RIFCSPHIGHO2_01_FULL_47_11b]|uniref:AMP-dependent synthetase/ligase domain-containing protein n=1 Tax=Candidatus Buchananbacteria bacterium RIFCSPHIGHO2_01_FULL_47_11b TaxID=1797537 RepID=A0A1G1Y540_9BACT|nr:MAG: hypothetical protein A2840_00430 [Candidatus Buchananbacteria bacterium RIFCSPHIGHO2_01_FULL_47_11b]
MKTIPQQFVETASRYPKRPALKFKYHGAYIGLSFSELARRVSVLAHGMRSLGIGAGERVAILSENRTEWVRADLASMTLGAIVIPVHTTLSPQIIKHILLDSGTTRVFVSDQIQYNKLLRIVDELPELKTVIYFSLDHPEHLGGSKELISLAEVMAVGERLPDQIELPVDPDAVASIVYTSGTTALPKGVMLTHRNFLFDGEAAVTAVPVSHHDTLLSFLPLSHVLERTAGYYAPLLLRGSCIAYAESIKTLAQNLREVKPTILVSVPRVFEKTHTAIWDKVKSGPGWKQTFFLWALKQEKGTIGHRIGDLLVFKKIRRSLGGRLRLSISGGASLNHKLARFFDRIGLLIVEGYGLTETAPVATVNRPDNFKFGTVGQQLPGVEVILAPDKEILVRGPNIMKGYYHNDALTKEVIDSEGWFHTGDLGFLTQDGFLVVIGRKKEMISLSNGKIVWPEQVELLLTNDRFITSAMVVGHNRAYLSALLIPDWQEVNRSLTELGITSSEPDMLVKNPKLRELFVTRLEKINAQMADWEKIQRFVLLPQEFAQTRDELTPTLKLRRATIEEHYKKQIESMY